MKMGWQAMHANLPAARCAGPASASWRWSRPLPAGSSWCPRRSAGLVRLLELTLNGGLWLAASISSGADAWTIVATVGRAVARSLVTPGALGAAGLLLLVGAGALFGLQRLLDSEEEESSR